MNEKVYHDTSAYKYLLIYLHNLKYTNTVAIQMRRKILQGKKISHNSIWESLLAQCDVTCGSAVTDRMKPGHENVKSKNRT